MSDTPRTDAQFPQTGRDGTFHADFEYVTADFARQLERENATIAAELKRMTNERDEWRKKHWDAHHHAHQMFLETVRLNSA